MQQHGLAAAVLAVLALAACHGATQQGPPALNVDVASAKRQDIATYLTLDGQIAPLEQSSLAFQQSGAITSIDVNVGDRVNRGELLARIDDSLLSAQLAQAEAAYQQASATARGAVVGLPVTQMQNTSAVSTAKAAYDNARLVYQQDSVLYRQGYVSQAALEAAHSAYVQAQSAYENATIGIRGNVVAGENVKASLASAQSALAQAHLLETEIAQTYLYAPYDGVITARLMDPGSQAGPSVPVLAISRVSDVWINVNVPDSDLAYVTPGKLLSFQTDSLPGRTFRGRVATVNAVPTAGTLSYLARITLPNQGNLLRGGMLVSVVATQTRHRNAIVVPRAAVAQTDQGSFVYAVAGGHARQVPVRVGLQTDTLSEVSSPRITAGTVVITTRPDALRDGSAVTVAGATPTP
ncbi:MAG TPA: efflux RND transporter periplasmic adaptor subunit [Candidatus Tyrphobacter sp.]